MKNILRYTAIVLLPAVALFSCKRNSWINRPWTALRWTTTITPRKKHADSPVHSMVFHGRDMKTARWMPSEM